MNSNLNRRDFVKSAGLAAVAASTLSAGSLLAAEKKSGVNWPIGCFNRPWLKFGYDASLDGVKGAGYKITGLLSRTKEEPFVASEVTREYLDTIKARLAARGLTCNMAAMRVGPDGLDNNVPLVIKEVRQQIDNAAYLKIETVLTFGVDKKDLYSNYYKVMADAADYAQSKKIKLVMKPHGGGSGASEEILRCMKAVNKPNFKVWYDAGNIIYYTNKDPVEELKPIVQHVTGFCAKDCGSPKGDVMIQFGTGKVDFPAVFKTLKAGGFNGPLMVECAGGATADEITKNAAVNREFLEKQLAML